MIYDKVRMVQSTPFLESARYLGITLADGAKEVCDNSIDANAHNIWVYIVTKKNGKHRIIFRDDGCGIAQEYEHKGKKYRGIEHVLSFGGRIAHEFRPFAIGRFGWGLSQTASSLSERTEVYTKTANDDQWRYSYYDYDELSADENCFVPDEVFRDPPYVSQTMTGTVVILDDVDTDNSTSYSDG